ncbi:MAG TPA: DUF4139 domain-containing protein [Terriglobia bacterium]|nr:DUF4139 domain-containing protein [Terriglobia bacterium]
MLIRRWRLQMLAMLTAAALAAANVALAQTKATSTEDDQQSLSLTVYNSNAALVRDIRSVRLPAGNVELQFADVASQIQPETVRIISLSGPRQLTVLEQNYRYDLLDPQKLFQYYVGKQVTLVRHITENNSTREVSTKATLLSDNNGPVWQVGNEIVTGMSADRFVFPALPPGLYSKPTLVWLLENKSAGEQKLEADYMTKAVNWNADYVLTLPGEDAVADLSSWVTVSNSSGVNFRNTRLQLVAGQVHQAVQGPQPMRGIMALEAKAATPGVSEEGLSEYHLYTIERPVTLPDNSSKQIAFVRASGIKVQKTYEITGQQFYFYSPYQGGESAKQPVEAHLKFKNSEGNSVGVPLPAGTVRVYQADSTGRMQFVGEDSISHTPKDEELNLNIGNAFDITAERKQTDFQNLGRDVYESAFQITIRNHKKAAVTVDVNEPVSGTWTVLQSNFKYEKTSAFSIRFRVPVEADGQSVLNYRVRVHR